MNDPMAIVYPEPLQSFRFLIQVDGSSGVSAAFTSFSGVKLQVDTLQSRDGDDCRGCKAIFPCSAGMSR